MSPFCTQCKSWHDSHAACRAMKVPNPLYAYSASPEPSMTLTEASLSRIPDDDISVCVLHPDRTRIARKLLAFLDEEPTS